MSAEALEQIRPDAMALEEVRDPHMPVGIFRDEINALLGYLGDEDNAAARERLLKTRVTADDLGRLQVLNDALDESQRRWNRVRTGRTSQEDVDAIAEAQSFRGELLVSCDYNTAEDRVAAGRLTAIRDGDGLSDLIDDYKDLKVFLTDYAPRFADDELSDLDAYHATIDATVTRLESIAASTDAERAAAKDLRDRVWTLALTLVREVRAGGRRAFFRQPLVLKQFQSAYETSARRPQRDEPEDGGPSGGGADEA